VVKLLQPWVRWPASLLVAVWLCTGCAQDLALFSRSGDAGLDAGVDGGSDGGVDGGSTVEMISAAFGHTCAIHAGVLSCWGDNTHGQLGLGDVQPRLAPAVVEPGSEWVEVAAGYEATCGRKRDGTVWCWGDNTSLQLGQGPGGMVTSPRQVSLGFAASAVSLHFQHACVLSEDGSVWCWGANREGQLGQSDRYPGVDQGAPRPVAAGQHFREVSAGQGHTCAVRVDGTLWCWGRNGEGELGQGDGSPLQIRAPVQVGTAADWRHVRASQNSSCGVRQTGQLYCWGDTYDPMAPASSWAPTLVGTDTDWHEVEIETFVVCGLKTGGVQQCWGRNVEGQLGTGDTVSVYTPVTTAGGPWAGQTVGRFHRCALDVQGTFFCTGENAAGQLGLGDTQRRSVLTPLQLP
jgi:alpha-tubulin suppressor-like RCC1 family protein